MTDVDDTAGQRDRSPAYPLIPLGDALERLAQFEAHFKRSAARSGKVGDAWGIKAKAYGDRIAAALRYFGLLEYQGNGKERQIVVSDDGRKYLRAQQEETKREVVRAAALRPKAIAKFWSEWGSDRPADAACLDDLVLKNGFSEAGAREFLKVYDSTISYAKLSENDKAPDDVSEQDEDEEEVPDPATDSTKNKAGSGSRNPPPPAPKGQVKIMDGERVAFTEEGQPGQYLKLIASGEVDDGLLEALEDFVKRQRKRLASAKSAADGGDTLGNG